MLKFNDAYWAENKTGSGFIEVNRNKAQNSFARILYFSLLYYDNDVFIVAIKVLLLRHEKIAINSTWCGSIYSQNTDYTMLKRIRAI